MVRRHVHRFIRRRLSSEEYLGLHLTVGLLVCLMMLAAFSIIAHSVLGQRDLTAFDDRLGQELAADRDASPATRRLFIVVTQFGSMGWLTALTVVIALALLVRRRRLLALVWAVALVATGLLNAGLKDAFGRSRPPWRDLVVSESNESFPSGHSMGSIITYGLLAYFLVHIIHRRWARVAVVAGMAVLALAIGFSRIYLGAHYFSDVAGGFAIGAAWLSACVSGLEVARRRAHQHKRKTAAEPAEHKPG